MAGNIKNELVLLNFLDTFEIKPSKKVLKELSQVAPKIQEVHEMKLEQKLREEIKIGGQQMALFK